MAKGQGNQNDGSKIEIVVPSSKVTLEGGTNDVELPVQIRNDVLEEMPDGKKRPYGAVCTASKGIVKKGKFYDVPNIEQEGEITIECRSRFNPALAVKTFNIRVIPKPTKATPSKPVCVHIPVEALETISEGKIPLTVSVENDSGNKGVDFFPEQGKVEEGNFIAPRVDEDLQVKVKVVSKTDPLKEATINIFVKAVEIKTSPIPATINAGGLKVDFHIQTLNDPSGNLKNFTCRIVSGKGELTSNGVYVSPATFRAIEEVVFQIRSTYTERELEFRFKLHPPLCNICNAWEVDPATGDCPACGTTKFSVTAVGFKCKGCGQPLVPGESCKKCGYPKAGVLKFF